MEGSQKRTTPDPDPTTNSYDNKIYLVNSTSKLQSRDYRFNLSKVVTLCLVLCSIFSPALGARSSPSSKGEKRVVCYYTNWSAYRQGPAKFLPDNINPYLCTHLVYAFGGLTSESGIKPFDKYQDIDKGGYTKFNGLKTYNKALKTMIAIGGWNEGSRRFSNLVADTEARKNFIKLAIRFLRQYQFDGLDLDWEYPASREGGVPEDKKNYALFIKELREAFEEESKSTGRARLLLTVAVPAGIEWIQKGFDIPTINRNIDFFNLLTYDYHASTEPNANHHAPLKARDGISEYDWKGQLNIEYSINYYLKEGADPDKLVVGLPTYGRSYTLFNVDSYDIDAPSSGPGIKGKFTKEPGYLAYYEICEGVKSGEWRVENADSETQGPHAVKNDQWVGYDDTRMMAIKSKWVKDQGLGGIMFWSIDNDDYRGTCHGKPFPLIEAAKLAYLTGDAPALSSNRQSSKLNRPSLNKNNRFSTSLSNRKVTTPAPPKTTTGAPSKSRRNKNRRNKNKKNKTTTTEATTTTTTEPPTTSNPLSTPAPPTTPDPGVDFECKEDGFFPHPRECKKYFWCLEAPGLGLVAHHFTCPAGLFFNKNSDSCDYARNVACKDKKAGDVTTTTTTAATTTTTTTKPTTTTRRTTTTTTTEAPEEEEDYDDEEYEDEEEEEKPVEKPKKVSNSNTGKSDDNNGRSVKEINDIKDLLKLIRKLGGVEELEKYLDENPGIAAAIEEYEDEEEEEKPKTSTTSALFTRNRFTPTTSGTTNTRPRFGASSNPVTAGSLKYTSIQRNRPSTTSTTTSTTTKAPDSSPETEEEDDELPVPTKKRFSSNTRPKYVTLSRNSKQNNFETDQKSSSTTTEQSTSTTKKAPSSTETSVVVRFSRDDEKILDEIVKASNDTKTDKLDKDDDGEGTDINDKDGYVQLSRKSTTTSSTDPKTEKPKTEVKKVEETVEEDDDGSEEYVSDEEVADEPSTTTTTTTKGTTTETPLTAKPRVRIPTRKTNGFASRTRGTTTSSTTSRPSVTTTESGSDDAASRKARNFAVGNRRNLYNTRVKSSSTTTTADPASLQSASEESIAEIKLLTSPEISRRAYEETTTATNQVQTQRPTNTKSRLRSIPSSSTPQNSVVENNRADINAISRSRSRYRSTTTTTEKTPLAVKAILTSKTSEPIVFRRRLKSKTTKSAATTTTTTTTTTRRPTTLAPKTTTSKIGEDDEVYYYYYYDDDDDEPLVPTVAPSKELLFQKTRSALGLRTETFTPSTSTAQLHKHQQNLALGGQDRGFAKRNLETQTQPKSSSNKPSSKDKVVTVVKSKSIENKSPNSLSSHKWSERAVVPLSEKIRLKVDGGVECLDTLGIFPHPTSCKKFVHCISTNDGSLRAWVYECPQYLTFDPVGGMCNYDEFAHRTAGNACIE